MSHEGRERMLAELVDAQALFVAADVKLSEVTKSMRERYGFTDEHLEKFFDEYQNMIKNDL